MDRTRHAKLLEEHYPALQCAWTQAGSPTSRSRSTRASTEQRLPNHASTAGAAHSAEHGEVASLQEIDDSVPNRAVKAELNAASRAGARRTQTSSTRRTLRMLTGRAHAPRETFNKIVPTSLDAHGRAHSCRLEFLRLRPGIQTASMSRRCFADPSRAIQWAMQVTAKLAERLAARMTEQGAIFTMSLPAASAKSLPAWSSAEMMPARTASGVVCALNFAHIFDEGRWCSGKNFPNFEMLYAKIASALKDGSPS